MRGGEATVRSDIYSLGVLLFHLVTGQYPVSATSLDDLRQAHREGRRFRLHDARPDLADDFARVVERASHPDPTRRYASAGALQEALARSLGLDSTITVDRESLAAALAAARRSGDAGADWPARMRARGPSAGGRSRARASCSAPSWWRCSPWLLPRDSVPALQRAATASRSSPSGP